MNIMITATAILILAFDLLIGNRASKPITLMSSAMSALSGGDTSVEITALDRRDEIDEMTQTVSVLKDMSYRKNACRTNKSKRQNGR